MAAKFKRAGLHRLECASCDGYGYFTVAQLEARGLPGCWCGQTLEPAELELALMLGVETITVQAYRAKVNSVAHGQASHYAKGRELESPEFRALYGDDHEPGILEQEREAARARRLAAIGLGERLVPDPERPRRKMRVRYRLQTEPMPF